MYHLEEDAFSYNEDFVYNTPEGEMPSDSYKAEAVEVCRKMIALGGFRLAHILVETLKTSTNELFL